MPASYTETEREISVYTGVADTLVSRRVSRLNTRALAALWKATVPHWVWIGCPAWIGAVLLGLDGRVPEWGHLALFMVTVLIIQSIAEFANSYTDRHEDRLYGPTNPLVTGELDVQIAKKIIILESVVIALLLAALLAVTLNYALAAVLILGWFFSTAYSVPPFRLKETVVGPLSHAIAFALLPVAGWLIVEPSLTAQGGLIIGFAAILFLHSLGLGITLKFRKTLLALDSGLVRVDKGKSLYSLNIVDFNVRFRTAVGLEELTSLGAFVLVPVFWHLGIFDSALSIALLALPLPLTALAMFLRWKDPVKHSSKYKVFMTLAWILIVVILLGTGVARFLDMGFAVLACIVFLAGFPLLVKIVHPWGAKSLGGRY